MTPPFDWAEGDELTVVCAAAVRQIRAQVSALHAQVAAWDLRPYPSYILGR